MVKNGFLLSLLCALFIAACGDDTTVKPDNNALPDETVTDTAAADETVTDTVVTDDIQNEGETADDAVIVPDDATDSEPTDDIQSDEEPTDNDVVEDPLLPLKQKMVGVWAQKLYLVAKATAPVVSQVTTKTTKLTRFTLTLEGTTLKPSYQVCYLDTDTGTDLVKTIFTDAFKKNFDAILSSQFPDSQAEDVVLSGTESELSLVLNKWYELRALKMTDPENELMPTDDADARIWDQDDDGKPGMTLKFQGVVTGDMYGAMRSWMKLSSTSGTATAIEGSIEWAEEDYVIEVTAPLLGEERQIMPQNDQSWFKMVKPVDQTMTCEQIIAQQDTLFAE